MEGGPISGEGHQWTVMLDVRGLGGHLDATHRARASTLAKRAAGVLDKVPVVGVLPMGFGGELRVLRTMHTPAALQWVEFSHISLASWAKCALPLCVQSGSMPLDHFVVLSLLDGPAGCDPGYHIVWCWLRMKVCGLQCWCFGLGSDLWVVSGCVRWCT